METSEVESFEARIVARGLVSEDELFDAQREANRRGRTVEETLVALGKMTEDQVGALRAEELGVAYVFPQMSAIDRDLFATLPRELLVRYRVAPLLRDGDEVVFVSAGPLNENAVRELEAACGGPVSYALSTPRRIDTLLGAPSPAEDPGAVAAFYGHLARAILADASEIRFEAGPQYVAVRYRIKGVLEERGKEPLGQILAISARATALANASRVTRIGQREFDLQVAVLQARQGESVLVRLLPAMAPVIDDEALRSALHRPHGVVVVAAPSLRSARLVAYAAMRAGRPESRSMVTLEREALEPEPRFRQVETRDEAPVVALRAALAYEPDVLFLGDWVEKRDEREAVYGAARRRVVIVPGAPDDWSAAAVITVSGREIHVVEKDR